MSTTTPIELLEQEARDFYQKGMWTQAIELGKAILAIDPHHPHGLMLVGMATFHTVEYEKSISFLLALSQQELDREILAQCLYSLRLVLWQNGNFQQAADYALQFLHLKKGVSMGIGRTVLEHSLQPLYDYLLVLICECIVTQKLKTAEDLCDQILKTAPSHPIASALKEWLAADLNQLMSQALDYHNQGNFQAAAEQYQKILQPCPDYPDALHGLGLVLWQQGQLESAQYLLELVVQLSPKTDYYHVNLGNIFAAQNQPDEAIAAWQQALQLEPQFYEAHESLGQLYIQLQQPQAALPHYQFMVQAQPDNPTHHHTLGNLYREVGQFEQALNHYQRAINLNPQYVLAYFNLANLYFNLGQKADAKACLIQISQLDPGFEPARQILTNWQD